MNNNPYFIYSYRHVNATKMYALKKDELKVLKNNNWVTYDGYEHIAIPRLLAKGTLLTTTINLKNFNKEYPEYML